MILLMKTKLLKKCADVSDGIKNEIKTINDGKKKRLHENKI